MAVARNLADKLGAQLKPMASLINEANIQSEADTVGFVSPVYDFKSPDIVLTFLSKFEGLEGKYVFAVCTYGVNPLKRLENLNKMLLGRGAKLHSGFAVMMPHNAVGNSLFSEAHNERVINAW